jgi:hypothetical protein
MTKTEIKSLYFGEAEIKPELRNEPRLWDVYISQNENGVLHSKCLSVVRHCYDTQEGYILVRVYEGLNHDIAYEVNRRVFNNNRRLYPKLGIFPHGKSPVFLSEEERLVISKKTTEMADVFRNSALRLIERFDLELLVDDASGISMVSGEIEQQLYSGPIRYWKLDKQNIPNQNRNP